MSLGGMGSGSLGGKGSGSGSSSWPGLHKVPKARKAKDAGYVSAKCADLEAGDGFDFVDIGLIMTEDDEYWLSGDGPWQRLGDAGQIERADIGRPVTINHYPVRRRVTPIGPPTWSCRGPGVGHGKDPGDTFCKVCSIIYLKLVED